MTRISVLGLGAMGSRMATRLLASGYEVTVWNRTGAKADLLAQQGARVADDPRAAVADADVVLSMVRDDDASRGIWLGEAGALDEVPKHAVLLESSTLSHGYALELARACRRRNLAFLDAPVAGSRPQADAGQLIFLVGGDGTHVERVRPVFDVLGGAVHHLGDNGAGAAFKLVVNALFGIQAAAMAELIAFMDKTHLDVAKAVQILSGTPVCSKAAAGVAGAMLAKNYAPQFPIELVAKDFRYAIETAGEAGTAVPMAEAARGVFTAGTAAGYGGDNISGVAQLY